VSYSRETEEDRKFLSLCTHGQTERQILEPRNSLDQAKCHHLSPAGDPSLGSSTCQTLCFCPSQLIPPPQPRRQRNQESSYRIGTLGSKILVRHVHADLLRRRVGKCGWGLRGSGCPQWSGNDNDLFPFL
jgi:hypothetical protein